MVQRITTVSDRILFQKAIPVGEIDQNIIELILSMVDTFRIQDHPKAVGLAANQVGRPEKIFLALLDKQIVPFINPEILESSKELYEPKKKEDTQLEGCLSIPGYFGEVKRPKWIKIKYKTMRSFQYLGRTASQKFTASQLKIVEKIEKFEDFPATIIQHEMDHLEGHLFTEKLLSQHGKLYKVVPGKDGKEEFEEVEI